MQSDFMEEEGLAEQYPVATIAPSVKSDKAYRL
jgi:hypothetical protein